MVVVYIVLRSVVHSVSTSWISNTVEFKRCSRVSVKDCLMLLNFSLLFLKAFGRFYTLWPSLRLDAAIDFADNQTMACPTLCATLGLVCSSCL